MNNREKVQRPRFLVGAVIGRVSAKELNAPVIYPVGFCFDQVRSVRELAAATIARHEP